MCTLCTHSPFPLCWRPPGVCTHQASCPLRSHDSCPVCTYDSCQKPYICWTCHGSSLLLVPYVFRYDGLLLPPALHVDRYFGKCEPARTIENCHGLPDLPTCLCKTTGTCSSLTPALLFPSFCAPTSPWGRCVESPFQFWGWLFWILKFKIRHSCKNFKLQMSIRQF